MSKQNFKTKTIELACPICGTRYQTPKKLPAPTCGNPNCIREARARGLPFAIQPPYHDKEPKNPKKPKE